MKILQIVISSLLIVVMIVFSYFSPLFVMSYTEKSFRNDYEIPDNISEYQVIPTERKDDWMAMWIWDKENLTKNNTWMCFSKKVTLDKVTSELIADISADSKYWLYINGENVVFEGSVKRGPDENSGYYDSIDIAPFLKEGENSICALVWFWGDQKNYSYNSSGQGGFIFEAKNDEITIISDNSWKVKKNEAYIDSLLYQPNYRLPEYSVYYDARKEIGDWLSKDVDFSSWENATEYANGGGGAYGSLYPRGIPMLKDFGLTDYENSKDYENYTVKKLLGEKITVDIPYNAQITPYLKIIAPEGEKIRITTENTPIGAVSTTYITKEGE